MKRLSEEELSLLPLVDLQRIRNKRWAHGLKELQKRVQEELERRDPRKDWVCTRCENTHFHEKEIRVAGGFLSSFIGWERHKYHALICNYCGKTEFYSVLMSASEESMGILGS